MFTRLFFHSKKPLYSIKDDFVKYPIARAEVIHDREEQHPSIVDWHILSWKKVLQNVDYK